MPGENLGTPVRRRARRPARTLLGWTSGRLVPAGPDSDTAYRTITTGGTATHRMIRVPLPRRRPASAVARPTGGTLSSLHAHQPRSAYSADVRNL
ncbi:hypothetical protein ACFSL4_35575 [Streptomyces caeni]|uniref:Uncharacterized protein n=1 Tax=Streptomyces caeni TaxID=2307231 RepID=A0ABW4J467_9ACTN